MDNDKKMTAQESLALIAETMNNNRRDILRDSARHFVIWGVCIVVFALAVYLLWSGTGNPAWNWLWFGITPVGYLGVWLTKDNVPSLPKSELGRMMGMVWIVYGVFCLCLCLVGIFIMPMRLTQLVVLMLGMAESMSGAVLRSWPVAIGGLMLGVGGVVLTMLLAGDAQVLLLAFGGALLLATGIVVKLQYK